MKITPTAIPDVLVFQPTLHGDERGYFMETFRLSHFSERGVDCNFVQDNQSKSSVGTLRGLHYQLNFPQGKLVRVLSGEVFDVAVDIREGSPTFGKWWVSCCRQKITNSFGCRQVLPTGSMSPHPLLSYLTNAPSTITPKTITVCYGTTQRWPSIGLCLARLHFCQTKTKTPSHSAPPRCFKVWVKRLILWPSNPYC